MKKLIKDIKGTALLVALLVMGVLVAIGLALSSLVFRELVITKEFLDAGRAYYTAESGVEIALYAIENHLPGWQPNDRIAKYEVADLKGRYELKNRCSAYPCFDTEEYDAAGVGGTDLKVFYGVLDKNESIQIPLFVVDASATVIPVGDFTVEFYATFDPKNDLKFEDNENLESWDILRWKIFGFPCSDEVFSSDDCFSITDSISDFTAFSLVNSGKAELLDDSDIIMNHSALPAWFGTVKCDDENGVDRLTDKIGCLTYEWSGNVLEYSPSDQIASNFLGFCDNTQAREYYLYKATSEVRELDDVQKCYSIKTFLGKHYLNYLTLTNLINSAVFNDENPAHEKIYYRVEFFADGEGTGNETVREVADITADGFSGDNKQSINVKMNRGSFMPVFNFSLYSTYEE